MNHLQLIPFNRVEFEAVPEEEIVVTLSRQLRRLMRCLKRGLMMNNSMYAVKLYEPFSKAEKLEATIEKNLEVLGYGG